MNVFELFTRLPRWSFDKSYQFSKNEESDGPSPHCGLAKHFVSTADAKNERPVDNRNRELLSPCESPSPEMKRIPKPALVIALLCCGLASRPAMTQSPPTIPTSDPAGNTPDTRSQLIAHASAETGMSKAQIRRLMRPTFGFSGQWYGERDDVSLGTLDARVTVPLMPIFGPPPPMLTAGFGWTDLDAPDGLDLPNALYETTLGLAWMRKWNDRWMFRTMLGIAFATDGRNESSDAWQFRGGAFALYQPNERWTWTLGAIALGRNDIPVVPAVGLIYQPRPEFKIDLNFPRPRASLLMLDDGTRQSWAYVGTGFSGGTWAVRRQSGLNDQLTYRDWLLVLGWESIPKPVHGMPFSPGRRWGLEVGYAFGRDFEFEEQTSPDLSIGDTITLRATFRF